MEREEGYIDSLNLHLRFQDDFEKLLIEYENGKLTRAEYIGLNMMASPLRILLIIIFVPRFFLINRFLN